jgi:hypothetical protein
MAKPRDFQAELEAACKAEDWEAFGRIWEERRIAEVEYDEAMLDKKGNEDEK